MKLLSKDLLIEYGFVINNLKTITTIEVMTKEDIDICIKFDGSIYTIDNNGIKCPLKDIAALRKLYREVKKTELKSVIKI